MKEHELFQSIKELLEEFTDAEYSTWSICLKAALVDLIFESLKLKSTRRV